MGGEEGVKKENHQKNHQNSVHALGVRLVHVAVPDQYKRMYRGRRCSYGGL